MSDLVTEISMVERAAVALLEQIQVIKSKIGGGPRTAQYTNLAPPPLPPPAPPSLLAAATPSRDDVKRNIQKTLVELRGTLGRAGRKYRTASLVNGVYYFTLSRTDLTDRFVAIIAGDDFLLRSDDVISRNSLKAMRIHKMWLTTNVRELTAQGKTSMKIGGFYFRFVRVGS